MGFFWLVIFYKAGTFKALPWVCLMIAGNMPGTFVMPYIIALARLSLPKKDCSIRPVFILFLN